MNNSIAETLERFYICTNLPIIAFDGHGSMIDSSGYNDNFIYLFKENGVYNKAIDNLQLLDNRNHIIIPSIKGINFTICLIDPKDINRGIYILGPHSCAMNNPLGAPYKPKCLINNLVTLLYIVAKDINRGRHFKVSYSYHVRKALDYMDTRYSENITLLGLSKYLNINKSYLCSLLKKETGKTFTQALNEVRIEKSKKLLMESNSSMLDVALQVGFNNQNYYNITFKKITGMTPLEYKKAA
ncbi:helix-turn-helix transcriptional regulator [Tissierella sp. Yu-01]|uniref:helix-turn-helix transcriptional regulator n=1 Tax=Tissierella sp. Yu-01 TaxID=3035694 RepID=UPI00240E809A|nr:helix-turn-helix transcriptional regulator [Tissierella sp. Yu-01]WFA08211.1 helix-turn-helix transcriptional regulator [Tissierella sp. Yu-01]